MHHLLTEDKENYQDYNARSQDITQSMADEEVGQNIQATKTAQASQSVLNPSKQEDLKDTQGK